MDVDSFSCFDVIFLEKKRANVIAIPEKICIYYVTLILKLLTKTRFSRNTILCKFGSNHTLFQN